jgi:chromosome segregation ATPase
MMPMMPLLGAAAWALGYGTPKPKTVEELTSERDKWEKQAALAQQIVLDVSAALSERSRRIAELEETLRVTDLRESEAARKYLAKVADMEKRIKALEAEIATAKAPTEPPKEP